MWKFNLIFKTLNGTPCIQSFMYNIRFIYLPTRYHFMYSLTKTQSFNKLSMYSIKMIVQFYFLSARFMQHREVIKIPEYTSV